MRYEQEVALRCCRGSGSALFVVYVPNSHKCSCSHLQWANLASSVCALYVSCLACCYTSRYQAFAAPAPAQPLIALLLLNCCCYLPCCCRYCCCCCRCSDQILLTDDSCTPDGTRMWPLRSPDSRSTWSCEEQEREGEARNRVSSRQRCREGGSLVQRGSHRCAQNQTHAPNHTQHTRKHKHLLTSLTQRRMSSAPAAIAAVYSIKNTPSKPPASAM